MLYFESDIFVWIGDKVPGQAKINCFKHVGKAARAVNSKGKNRRDKISFSIVQ